MFKQVVIRLYSIYLIYYSLNYKEFFLTKYPSFVNLKKQKKFMFLKRYRASSQFLRPNVIFNIIIIEFSQL